MDTLNIEGTWQPVRAEMEGELAPEMALDAMRMIFSEGRYRLEFGEEMSDEGHFVVEREAERFLLTLRGIRGVNAGRTIPALAQLRGDRLRVCYGLNGILPSDFAAGLSSACYLVTYRRQ